MSRILSRLKAFVDHPVTHFVIGLALITTGGMDLYADVIDESRRFRIGAHHGIIILGLAQALSAAEVHDARGTPMGDLRG
jgi:hypothetical protein